MNDVNDRLKHNPALMNQHEELNRAEEIQRRDPKASLEIADKVILQLDREKNLETWLRALYIKSRSAWYMGQFDEATVGANEVLESAEANGYPKYVANACNLIGNVHLHLDNLDKALEMYRSGMKPAEECGDYFVLSALNNNIGEIYNRLHAYDTAKEYYEKSLAHAKKLNKLEVIAIAYLNLAEIAIFKEEFDQADRLLDQALYAFKEHDDRMGESGTHQIRGELYDKQGRHEEAITLFHQAIALADETEDRYNRIRAGISLITSLIHLNRLYRAEEEAQQCLTIAKEINAGSLVAALHSSLATIYETKGDYQRALTFYKNYHDTDKQNQKEIMEERLNHMKLQSRIEQTQSEKEIFELRNVELKAKHDELKKLYDDISTISKIGKEITSTLDLQVIVNRIYQHINNMMDAIFFGITLYDEATDVISYALYLSDGVPAEIPSTTVSDPNSLAAWVIRNRQEIFITDYLNEYHKYKEDYTKVRVGKISQSIMSIPLAIKDDIVGVLTVQSYERNAYTTHNLDILRAFGSFIAIAIRNGRASQLLEQEIKERKTAQENLEELNVRLSELTYIDALTHIPNRRRFIDFLSHELHRSIREQEPLSVIIIDVDKFKEYNDNYGHLAGDVVLRKVAEVLESGLNRQVDFVARYGGDEFVVVLPNTDQEGGLTVAEKLRESIENEGIEHDYSTVASRLSITLGGYSMVPDQSMSLEKIVHLADQALYVAKSQGRNTSIFNECLMVTNEMDESK